MEMIAISSNSLTLNSIRSGDYYINMSGISTNPNPYSDKSRYTYGIEIPFMPGSTKDNTVVSNDGLVAVFLNDVIEICDLFSKGSKDYSAYSPKNMESHANPAFEMRFLVRPDSAKTGLKAIRNIVMMDGSKIISRDDGYSASYTENDRTDNISSTDDYDISMRSRRSIS